MRTSIAGMAQRNPLALYTKKIVADATEHEDRRDGPKNEYGHGFLLLSTKNGGERVAFPKPSSSPPSGFSPGKLEPRKRLIAAIQERYGWFGPKSVVGPFADIGKRLHALPGAAAQSGSAGIALARRWSTFRSIVMDAHRADAGRAVRTPIVV